MHFDVRIAHIRFGQAGITRSYLTSCSSSLVQRAQSKCLLRNGRLSALDTVEIGGRVLLLDDCLLHGLDVH